MQDGKTPLHTAADSNSKECLELLLSHGAKVDIMSVVSNNNNMNWWMVLLMMIIDNNSVIIIITSGWKDTSS